MSGLDKNQDETAATVRYPDCVVQLGGTDGNAVLVFRKVRKELIRHLRDGGMDHAEATAIGDEFQEEATAGDYDNVLITCHRWITVV